MNQSETKVLERQCDSCGKTFKVKVAMAGRYKVTCPHCKSLVRFAVTKEKAPGKAVIAPRLVVPELGLPEKVRDKFYVILNSATL